MLSQLAPASPLQTEHQDERQGPVSGGGFKEVLSVISAYILCMLGFMYGARDLTEATLRA